MGWSWKLGWVEARGEGEGGVGMWVGGCLLSLVLSVCCDVLMKSNRTSLFLLGQLGDPVFPP